MLNPIEYHSSKIKAVVSVELSLVYTGSSVAIIMEGICGRLSF